MDPGFHRSDFNHAKPSEKEFRENYFSRRSSESNARKPESQSRNSVENLGHNNLYNHSFDEVYGKLMDLERKHAKCEGEKHLFQTEISNLRSIITKLENENDILEAEMIDARNELRLNQYQQVKLEGQLMGYEKYMSYRENGDGYQERGMHLRDRERYALEEEVLRYRNGVEQSEHLRRKFEKQKNGYQTVNLLLRNAINRMERDKRDAEIVGELSASGRTILVQMSQMEREIKLLNLKMQEIQAQLAESKLQQSNKTSAFERRTSNDLKKVSKAQEVFYERFPGHVKKTPEEILNQVFAVGTDDL